MKILRLSFFVIYALFALPVYAGGGTNVSSLVNVWGGGKMLLCLGSTLSGSEACIGASAPGCDIRGVYARDRDKVDEYAMQMMVARKVTERGAYFCPTQLEGKSKKHRNAWTEAADLNSTCVWLCKEGYTGATCDLAEQDVRTCDATLLRRSNYSSLGRAASGPNIEESVAMFEFNVNDGCGANYTQEHDMILVITGWLPSGHGAKVRQMIWRAQRGSWSDWESWSAIYPATNSEDIIVCKNGYRPNYNNTDCEEIEPVLCQMQNLCSGWADFNMNIHSLYQVDDSQDCFQYRCSDKSKAFVSATDRTCEACTSEDGRVGVSPADGTCVRCQAGQIFDENSPSSGYCVNALVFSKTDLVYGKNKTKTSNLADQCWLISYPDDYINCVKGNTTAETGNTNTFIRVDLTDTNEGANAATNTDSGLSINNINTAGNVIGTTMGVAGIMPAN